MQFPTEEEQQRIKNYILLPLLLTVFERDKKVIESAELKTPGPYIDMMDAVIRKVEQDIVQGKKQLRAKGIKIFDENRTDQGLEWKYVYKGWQHKGQFVWDVVRVEVVERMRIFLISRDNNQEWT
jgi:hypothetical protein